MHLDMAADGTNALLRSLKKNEPVKIRFGKRPSLQYGSESSVLNVESSAFPCEVFSGSAEGGPDYYFSGKLSHTVEVHQAQEATAKADRALAVLESSLKSMQEEKANSEASFARGLEEMNALHKPHKPQKSGHPQPLHASSLHRSYLLGGVTKSTPASPFLGPSDSSRPTPTSAPSMGSGVSDKDKLRLNAMRIPLVHMLAVSPSSVKILARSIRAPLEDVERVLAKIARDSTSQPGKQELKEKAYRELDVWKFCFKSPEDRQAAIDHAVHAYDKMRVATSDKLWQMLLPEGERWKGKCLTRLNFDRPAQRSVRLEAKPWEEDAPAHGESDSSRGRMQSKDSKARAHSNEPMHRKKISEKETLSKKQLQKDAFSQLRESRREKSQSTEKRMTKSNSKYKSSEFIEDSDEEVPPAKEVVGKVGLKSNRRESPSTKANSRPPSNSTARDDRQMKPVHSSHLSTSSADGSSSNSKQRDVPSNSKHADRIALDKAASRSSSRPRTDSSPQKPSPLASSPPTNSSDVDNSSSEKATSLSSMTSSPPSSSDMPAAGKKTFSPVTTDSQTKVDRGRSPVKRKADDVDNEPPSKRHQPSVSSTDANGGTPAEDETPRPKAPQRQTTNSSSGSTSSLSPDKPAYRTSEVIEKSKRFHLYYDRYKKLHEKVAAEDLDGVEDQEVKELWKMHSRLKELKEEIWSDFHKLGKPDKIAL